MAITLSSLKTILPTDLLSWLAFGTGVAVVLAALVSLALALFGVAAAIV